MPAFRVGQKVKHPSTGEVGVVVWLWEDKKADAVDAYIAFFGKRFPKGAPKQKPYVLRYFTSGLMRLD